MDVELFNNALALMAEAHRDQTDACGHPMTGHPLRVMAHLVDMFGPQPVSMLAAALLHDIVEDTPVTPEQIKEQFGADVFYLVDGMTRRNGETYWAYIDRIIEYGSDVIKLKLADMTDNMDSRRIFPEKEDWHANMMERRYNPSYKRLQDALAGFAD